MNDHVRPCNLKLQQRDLTPVLRRPVEPAPRKRTSLRGHTETAFIRNPTLCESEMHAAGFARESIELAFSALDMDLSYVVFSEKVGCKYPPRISPALCAPSGFPRRENNPTFPAE